MPRPTLTVVVPYHNEKSQLPYLLETLKQQTLQPDHVILVNSSSSDDGPRFVDEWIRQHNLESSYTNLDARTNTPGGSKTAGVMHSASELFAFMDCGLSFPVTWLEQQVELLTRDNADWVSGVCRTAGSNLIDRAAIAHTYGHQRERPVIPSSVVRRTVFNTVGMFKDLRAGYDAEWAAAAKRAGLQRSINPSVIVEYRSVNFAATLADVFRKSLRYARPSVGRDDTWTPIIYVSAAMLGVVLLALSTPIALLGLLAYLLARLTVARLKSPSLKYFFANPLRVVALVLVGGVMDIGKLLGFGHGLFLRFIRRQSVSH